MPHQFSAKIRMKNGCILKGGVGSGKSRTALAYFTDNDPEEGIEKLYIITTARKRDNDDWVDEAKLFGITPVIDSWNNLSRYRDVQGAFFIFDEQRVVGSGSWVDSFLKITKKNQWIVLSATPGDTWLDYIPIFLANGFFKYRTDFLRTHVVFASWTKFPKVERYLGEGILEGYLRKITVEMPFERHTTRHMTDVYCEYDRDLYETVTKRRWNYLEGRPIKNVAELFSLMRRVVNSDPSRLERVRDLMILHPRIVIFYNFNYELEILRTLGEEEDAWNPENSGRLLASAGTGGNSGLSTATAEEHGCTSTIQPSLGSFAVAEWNGHKHDDIPDTDSWAYLVQYTAGAEGWNCVETDAEIFYSMNYSYKIFEQSQGRIDRINTSFTDLHYYVLRSSSMIDNAIAKSLGEKKTFNEKDFLRTSV